MIAVLSITAAEAMLFREIRLRALQDSPDAFSSNYAAEACLTDREWVKRVAQWTGAGSVAFVALDDGVACGVAAGYLQKDDPTRVRLVSLWTAPTHRRRGLGRMLVERVAGWAQANRARTVCLLVTSSNEPAMRFYQCLGFTRTGHAQPYPNDPALLEYGMAREIG